MKRLLLLITLGVAGGALVVAGFWVYRFRRPQFQMPSRAEGLPVAPAGGDFDVAYQLPQSVLGLATNGEELIAGVRKGGALRIRVEDESAKAKPVTLLEPDSRQNVNVNALAWNGTRYAGVTSGAWFQLPGEVFTIHDPASLRVMETRPAPDLIGCLAWDGRSYWAATRKHTRDQQVPSLLYRLDSEFRVLGTTEAPGAGCQGMAFDGRYLWLADVFSDAITIVDPSQSPPAVIRSVSTPLSYLSGLAFFGGQIWVIDYEDNRLRRLRPDVRLAWAGAAPTEPQLASLVTPVANAAGEPVRLADADENGSPSRAADDAELLVWSVELRGGSLYGSWRFWYGHDLFARRGQTGALSMPEFARYTITVETPSKEKIEQQFEAAAGENAMTDVRLCDASASGLYEVSYFLHAQYVTADETNRILNRSGSPLRVRQ